MPNALLTPTIITKETLRILENNLVFAKNVNRDFDKNFNKIGASVTVRKPVRFIVTQGSVALSVQDVQELSVVVTLTNQDHIDFTFSTQELTLTIDEFKARYITPAAAALANVVDVGGCLLYKDVSSIVGTAGTTPNAYSFIASVAQRLDERAAPDDGMRALVVSPAVRWALSTALGAGFNPQSQISTIFQKGLLGKIGTFDIAMDQNIVSHTWGARGGAPIINGAPANGATSLVTSGWTAAAAVRVNQGDVFTLPNVFSVNPQTRLSTGVLQPFVATATVSSDGAGAATIPVSPPFFFSGPYQNINIQPVNGGALTFLDTLSSSRAMSIGFHKDAFTLVVRPLELPEGVHFAGRQSENGLSIRIVRQYAIATDTIPCRMDILYGWRTIYEELACRLTS